MRVVSLLPSATEIVAAIGMESALVGRSAECDWPPRVLNLPVVTAARVPTEGLGSRAIDQRVREAIAEGASLYAVDERLIRELEPDLVITQDLCQVCAVSSGEVRSIQGLGADVLSLDPRTVGQIEGTVDAIADRLGVCERGGGVVHQMRRTILDAAGAVRTQPPRRVVVLEWVDPPFACGHWLPEMVEMAGGAELLGREGEPSRQITWDDVRGAEPEMVVLAACGFDAHRTAEEAGELPLDVPVVAVDANARFSRPAPRVAEGVAQLAHLFHPDAAPDPGYPAVWPRPRAS